jgi:hypothetical protein
MKQSRNLFLQATRRPGPRDGKKDVEPSETEGDDLMGLLLEELNKKASELNVPGRDTMNKEQLILAIR